MTPKPHVSPALAHLRFAVTAMAALVAVAVTIQLLVFGFVHFTEARWEVVKAEASQQLTVVTPQGGQGKSEATPPAPASESAGQPRRTRTLAELEADKNVRVLSTWHFVLKQFSDAAVTVGVAATLSLALLVMLGVAVAGGAAVPGIEKVVTASAWALLLCFLTVPMRDVLASVPFGGVLSNYEAMVASSEAVTAGQGSTVMLLSAHLAMPIGALCVAMMICFRFWGGVSKGIIVTSVNELDQLLEREMDNIRAKGVGSNYGPRTVGTLNTAVGESQPRPARSVPRAEPVEAEQEPAPAVREAPRSKPLGQQGKAGEWRRPI